MPHTDPVPLDRSFAFDPICRTTQVVMEFQFDVPRGLVWKAMTDDLTAWWPVAEHSAGGPKARGMCLDLRLGGRIWEDWGGENGFVWYTIIALERGRLMEMVGHHHRPSQIMSRLKLELEGEDPTFLRVTDALMGPLPDDLPDRTRAGWREILGGALRNYLTGHRF